MGVRKVVRRRVRRRRAGVDQASDVNIVVAANVGSSRQRTVVTSRQRASTNRGTDRRGDAEHPRATDERR